MGLKAQGQGGPQVYVFVFAFMCVSGCVCVCVCLWFLVAVHCDITVRYMTLVMSLNRSIYPFTPERPRDLSARTPEPALSGVPILRRAPQISLGKKIEQEYQIG